MVRIAKRPLKMANGVIVRTIEDLKNNFDIEIVVGYFLDGNLSKWLETRGYKEELEQVDNLTENDTELAKKLCDIFCVEYIDNIEIDTEDIIERKEKLLKLKQYTDDEEIIANVDSVAFNQEELADLYDKGVEKIYLCEGEFEIPEAQKDLEYIELSGAKVKYPKSEKAIILPSELADIIYERRFVILKDYIVWRGNKNDLEEDFFNETKVLDNMDGEYYVWNFKNNSLSSFDILGSVHTGLSNFVPYGNKIIFGYRQYYHKALQEGIYSYDVDNRELLNIAKVDDIDQYSLTNINNNKLVFEKFDSKHCKMIDLTTKIVQTIPVPRADAIFGKVVYYFYEGNVHILNLETQCEKVVYVCDGDRHTRILNTWLSDGEFFLHTYSNKSSKILGIKDNGTKTVYYYIDNKYNYTREGIYADFGTLNSPYFHVFIDRLHSMLTTIYVFDKKSKKMAEYNLSELYKSAAFIDSYRTKLIENYLYFKYNGIIKKIELTEKKLKDNDLLQLLGPVIRPN